MLKLLVVKGKKVRNVSSGVRAVFIRQSHHLTNVVKGTKAFALDWSGVDTLDKYFNLNHITGLDLLVSLSKAIVLENGYILEVIYKQSEFSIVRCGMFEFLIANNRIRLVSDAEPTTFSREDDPRTAQMNVIYDIQQMKSIKAPKRTLYGRKPKRR